MTILSFLLLAVVSQGCGGGAPDGGPGNFVYFGRDHEPALEAAFLEAPGVDGAQLTFTWRQLEPTRGQYDFAEIERYLELLAQHGKRLWIQLADVTFTDRLPVPEYLRADTAFHGGAARKYEGSEGVFDGWVARRWDPAVRGRLAALFAAVAAELDGRIAGMNLAETAIGFEDPRFHPPGFSFDAYASGIRAIMRDARRAFTRSCVIVYANFMPGEALPVEDNGYLRGIYQAADELGVGVGGPDLLPYREGQRNNSLPLIASRADHVVAGMAVQDGNLSEVDPATGEPVTIDELYRIARDEFRLDYVFWGREEPYYSRDVLPFLAALGR
jgi:hypothetical protein